MDSHFDNVIEQIAQSIYATMLNIDLVRSDEPASQDRESLLATVQIAGAWVGSVVLTLSPELALASSAAMFKVAAQDVTAADRQEVAAELVNMIGGNLKSLLPGPSFLSLPTIVAGREFGLQVHDATLLDDVVLKADRGSLRVHLYAKLPESLAS